MTRTAILAALLLTTPALAAPPAPEVQSLLGRSESALRVRLGEPYVARREDQGAMWTYRLPGCALFVFFRASGREGLRVVGAASGPRRRGEPAPAVDACLAGAPVQAPRNS
jgi:hypothetical protein